MAVPTLIGRYASNAYAEKHPVRRAGSAEGVTTLSPCILNRREQLQFATDRVGIPYSADSAICVSFTGIGKSLHDADQLRKKSLPNTSAAAWL